jgi:UDP-N-acetylmuramoyl-L-alanyl-D-glutamate--2,6-diaminopimelate ligase
MAERRAPPTLDSLLHEALPELGDVRAPAVAVRRITGDSRAVQPGDIFVATAGTRFDGHDFVADAVRSGAAAVIAQRPMPEAGAPVVIVPDSRSALARLVAAHSGLAALQAERRLRVVGITGTNGKSTTTYLVRSILQKAGHKVALLGTIGYELAGRHAPAPITTPSAEDLTGYLIEAAEHGCRWAVMEVSSHGLDQRRCDGVRYAAAVFTNLTGDHLDYHGDLEHYGRAKKRLFDGLDAEAIACLNADDPQSELMSSDCKARRLSFALDADADCKAKVHSITARESHFELRAAGRTIDVRSPLIGRHNVMNACAAAAVGIGLGLDAATIRAGLEAVRLVPGRLQPVTADRLDFAVLVDYAHTDDALRNVLSAVRPLTRGRLWCVFGCGGDRDRSKRPRMAAVTAELADRLIVTSDNPRTEPPEQIIDEILAGLSADDRRRCVVQPDRRQAIYLAIEQAETDDVVLIAGKGHEDYQIIGTTRHPFDDAQVAGEAIAKRLETAR